MRVLSGILGILVASNCYAGEDFKCVVTESVELLKNGELSRETNVARSNIGKEFVVNRRTGQMTGGGFTNTMSGQMPKVYNHLPQENGFKALTIYEPDYTIDYLKINEYVDGPEKPFLYIGAWGEIVSGKCTYY